MTWLGYNVVLSHGSGIEGSSLRTIVASSRLDSTAVDRGVGCSAGTGVWVGVTPGSRVGVGSEAVVAVGSVVGVAAELQATINKAKKSASSPASLLLDFSARNLSKFT